MCVVSNIGDHYGRGDGWPWKPGPFLPIDPAVPEPFRKIWEEHVENADVADLKKRVAVLEALIRKGKKFDEQTGQPDCETDEKWKELRRLAEELGVKLDI